MADLWPQRVTVPGRSSLIGVSISLAGNILISLALNCQKLAHLRLQNEARTDKVASASDSESAESSNEEEADEVTVLINKRGERVQQYDGRKADRQAAGEHSNAGEEASCVGDRGREQDDEVADRLSTDFLHSRIWWLGLALMSLGELGNFLSYGFAPASLVAPLGAVALLSNVVFAPILLHERFRLSDLGGILLAIIGAVTVVFSSKQSDTLLDPQQLLRAVSRTEFIAYCITSCLLTGLLTWTSFTRYGDRFVLVDVGVCALFGGFTVLSTKGLSSLLTTGRPLDLLQYPITYGLLTVLVGTALAQVTFLNRALQRFDSREVIPTQFVSFTISAIVGSAVLYQDFADMGPSRLLNFLFGCLTTFAGVLLLTSKGEESGDRSLEGLPDGGHQSSEYDLQEEPSALESADRTSRRSGPSTVAARPVAVPRTHPAATNLSGRSGKRSRSGRARLLQLPVGSLPPIGASNHVSTDPRLLVSSYGDVRNGHRLSARRSIFNPAFTIAYMETPGVQQLPRRGPLL